MAMSSSGGTATRSAGVTLPQRVNNLSGTNSYWRGGLLGTGDLVTVELCGKCLFHARAGTTTAATSRELLRAATHALPADSRGDFENRCSRFRKPLLYPLSYGASGRG